MVKILAHQISLERPAQDLGNELNDKWLADLLLEYCENAGMLPPSTMRYIDQLSGNTLCSEVCEWDEE